MEMFWFFQLWFCWAYDFAYDSDIRFSLGHKLSYNSDYDSDSDSVASENQPLSSNSGAGMQQVQLFVQFQTAACPWMKI